MPLGQRRCLVTSRLAVAALHTPVALCFDRWHVSSTLASILLCDRMPSLPCHCCRCRPCCQCPWLRPLTLLPLGGGRRFESNPYVREAGVRFYAGCPLISSNGHRLGTLCFADRVPRVFDSSSLQVSETSPGADGVLYEKPCMVSYGVSWLGADVFFCFDSALILVVSCITPLALGGVAPLHTLLLCGLRDVTDVCPVGCGVWWIYVPRSHAQACSGQPCHAMPYHAVPCCCDTCCRLL